MMKFLSLVILAILSATNVCFADQQSGLFRDAYACPSRGRSSICVYGTIPGKAPVTLIARGWKSAAQPKERFSNKNEEFHNGIATSTRLQVATQPPKGASMIAVLAPEDAVNEIRLEEIQDRALVQRIGEHIKRTKELKLAPDIRLLQTRLFRLSPTILLSETFLSAPNDVAELTKQLPSGCDVCEKVPLMVGTNLHDLFREVRPSQQNDTDRICGGIKLAFTLSGQTYALSNAFICESDAMSATLVHDLSGPAPKLVLKTVGGL
ncbi:hypothetical protein [Bradyrhizobium sacchari]|uniref:Uncharacterized protein n=1 Tax=Bradyrhizobium sacchari TaxID=1399419 RepID=A0A560IAA6_9BRAD|nr:hypothetical protein [Bradyrhizobium sacchari]TWB53900.1 hypothetical protein FBZ94_108182 [Bradyrhizobium sacchari]TWB78348.1 hypothetical protein FBZ95_103182 [Bradyrhizobium sacchari]